VCHRDGERLRRAHASFLRFSALVYQHLEADGPLEFTLDEFRASNVMRATEKAWIDGTA